MTTDEADAVVDMPKKIGEPIVWTCHDKVLQKYRMSVPVIADVGDVRLMIWGRVSFDDWAYGLRLTGSSNHNLRRISTPHEGHKDPERGGYAPPEHKHRWTQENRSASVYFPDDIAWDNFNQALVDFLAECKIVALSDIPELRLQESF